VGLGGGGGKLDLYRICLSIAAEEHNTELIRKKPDVASSMVSLD